MNNNRHKMTQNRRRWKKKRWKQPKISMKITPPYINWPKIIDASNYTIDDLSVLGGWGGGSTYEGWGPLTCLCPGARFIIIFPWAVLSCPVPGWGVVGGDRRGSSSSSSSAPPPCVLASGKGQCDVTRGWSCRLLAGGAKCQVARASHCSSVRPAAAEGMCS